MDPGSINFRTEKTHGGQQKKKEENTRKKRKHALEYIRYIRFGSLHTIYVLMPESTTPFQPVFSPEHPHNSPSCYMSLHLPPSLLLLSPQISGATVDRPRRG